MSLRVVCPECGSAYIVAEELRGRKARCLKCSARVVLEDSHGEAPPRPEPSPRRRDRPTQNEPAPRRSRARRKKSSALVPLVIVGGLVISLLAAFGAAVGVWHYWKSQQPAPVAANGPARPGESASPTGPGGPRSFWAAALPPFESRPVGGSGDPAFDTAPDDVPREGPVPPPAVQEVKPAEVPAATGGQLAPDVLSKVKRATVYLRVVMANGTQGSGSGFVADDTGTVVTNAHVLGMLQSGSAKPRTVEAFLNSGERDEKLVNAEFVGVERGHDLALLRIPSAGLPPPLPVRSADTLYETQPLWVTGFPFGEQLGKNVTVTACPVSSLRKTNGVLTRVQVHGDMQPGNSGGPVVDAHGNVVGVAVSIIRLTRINFAIPGDAVIALLHGQPGQLKVGVPYEETGQVNVPLTVSMHDLLRRVRKVAVDFWVGEPGRARPPSAVPPAPRKTDGARTSVTLTYEPNTGQAQGTLTLPVLPEGKVYWLQPVYEDGRGTTHWASGTTYRAPPPVVRKPAHLVFKPDGKERAFTLSRTTTLRLHYSVDRLHEVGARMITRFVQGIQPGGAGVPFELRRRYSGLTLEVRYNRGQPQDSPLPPRLAPHLASLSTTMKLDAELRTAGEEVAPDLSMLEADTRQHLSALHALTQQTLDALTVTLPGKNVAPGENWKPQPRNLYLETFDIGYAGTRTLSWTCTYAGTRQRAGREEAVVALEGSVDQLVERAGGVARVSGLAHVDLQTGRVTRLDAAWQLDFETRLQGVSVPVRNTTEIRLDETDPDAGQ